MAPTRRHTPRTYTLEEKLALVTEIERRYRSGEGTLRAIAAELGTTDQNYHNWLKAGIRPVRPTPTVAPPSASVSAAARIYAPDERERLLADVEGRRKNGQSTGAACREAGISVKSYRKWKEAAPQPAMRPVEVTALVPVAPAVSALVSRETGLSTTSTTAVTAGLPALTLVAPGGYRIEGLAVESAAQLLKALACQAQLAR